MAASEDEYRVALQAFVKLSRASDTIDRRIGLHDPLPAGMTLSQFAVLEVLLHRGALTHHEVAEKVLKTRGNITTVVNQLERHGLVVRRRCEHDRRRVFLDLTERGRVAANNAFRRVREAIRDEMSVLTAAELVELGRLCKKLGTAPRYPVPEERAP